MLDEKGTALALDGAEADYLLATEVCPRDLHLRFERGDLYYVHGADMSAVAAHFAELTQAAQAFLCRCAATRIKALDDAERTEEARAELGTWRARFPDEPSLAEAAAWLGV
jgi:hypothetical protein